MNRPLLPLLILSCCLFFVGFGGFVGGIAMLADPNGSPMDMPVSDLEATPFDSFLVPGIVLISVWGFGSLVILLSLWIRPNISLFDRISETTHEHWAWSLTLLLGSGLLVWLTVQVFTLPSVIPIQYVLYCLSILITGIPLLPNMRQYYLIK